jgi:3-phenylpropionate/trans-cinnamate dioxygenase ferredoxin reductase subunit
MPEVVIIGASAAGFSACCHLAQSREGLNITLLSQEKQLPCRKDHLPDFIEGKLKKKDVFLCAETFFKEKNINFLPESKVTNVDFQRRRVILRNNRRLAYDYLIIASGRGQRLEIPGKNKQGVVVLSGLEDAETLKERLMIPGSIAFSGEMELIRRIGGFFAVKGREVKLLAPLAEQAEALAQANPEIIFEESIVELIGEGRELKAIRLNSGKIIGVSTVAFCGRGYPCTDFLAGGPLVLEDGYIKVDDNMFTGTENVFACGAVCAQETRGTEEKWDTAVNKGIKAAAAILLEIFGQPASL